MSAYVVFIRDETLNPIQLAEYSAKVDASFEGHEMKLLVDYGTIETLEGSEIEGAVILCISRHGRCPRLVSQPRISGDRATPFQRSAVSRIYRGRAGMIFC